MKTGIDLEACRYAIYALCIFTFIRSSLVNIT